MLSMCRFVFLFLFFSLLFQNFCFARVCKGAPGFLDNASVRAAKESRIEIPASAEFKIEYDKSIIKISFSSGVLFADYVFLSGVKTLEFNNSRNISFEVSCDELRYFPNKNAVKLSGNVLFTISDREGTMIKLSSVFIDLKEKIAFSNDSFSGSFRRGGKIYGSGFKINLENGQYEISDMRTEINKHFNF